MNFKKIIAVFVCLAAMLTFFASCDFGEVEVPSSPENEEVLAAFEKSFSAPYKMTENGKTEFVEGDSTFASSEEEYTTVFYMDGRNYYTENTEGGTKTVTTFVDETMYINDNGSKYKYSVPISQWEDYLKDTIGEAFPDEALLVNYQEVKRVKNADGTVTFTYTKPLNNPKFDVMDMDYTIGGVRTTVKTDKDSVVCIYVIGTDGRIKSSHISMQYTMSVVSEKPAVSYTTTMKTGVYTEYDYEDVRTVTVPEDADEYTESGLGGIFGNN